MKKHKPYRFLSIIFFLFSVFTVHSEGQTEQIPMDPQAVTGKLENGLQFYIRENKMPRERAYLQLAINAGSTQEDNDQRGMAHFLEHMAFNGTEKYHKNDLVKYLQGIGMQFGPDINAHTSFDETVYKLMIPLDDPENLEKGLEILEQWAFHMSLNRKDIEEERGIILEERRSGLGASRRMMDAAYPDLMYNSLYAERLPIGTEESIQNCTPNSIRRFYQDWYRPELMAVIAVGDFDGREVAEMISKRFSSYSNPPLPRERTEAPVPDHGETIFSVQSDKEATWTAAIIFNKFPRKTIRTEEDYREEIMQELYIRMFNNRLTELLDLPLPPFTYAYADFTALTREKSFHTMTVLTGEDGLYTGYRTLLLEEKKLKDHGFIESELERAVKELTSEFHSFYENRQDMESADIAGWYLQHFLDREPIPGISYQWEKFSQYAPGITTREIQAMAEKWLTGENRVVYVMTPEKEELQPVDPVELSRINVEISRTATQPPLEQKVSSQLMDNSPAPGEITEKEYFQEPDFYQWTLSNGATVVLKQTDLKENEILFSAKAPGGLSLAGNDLYLSASLSDQAVIQSGAGGFSKREIEKILAGSTAAVEPVINELTSGLRGSCTREDLEKMLQLSYLYFTDPGKDPDLWQSYSSRLKNNLANRESSPMNLYSDLITNLLYQNHPRKQPLTVKSLENFNLEKAFDFYQACFSGAAGYTFYFVGSISPEELEKYIPSYLGGLPTGNGQQNWIDRNVRYPGGVIKESLTSGIDPVSYVTMIYTGTWEWSDKETEIFQALSESLDIILNERLREEASGTYSPGIGAYPARIPHENYSFLISFSCDPERTEELIDLVHNIIEELKETPPEKRITDDVAKSRQVYREEQMQKNSFWLSRLERTYFLDMPREMIIPRDYLTDGYTPEIFQNRIRQYLNPENYLEILLYPSGKTN